MSKMKPIKLSQLNNDDMLLVGENLVISKEDYVKEIKEHIGEEVYTTIEYRANINAKRMLESAIEQEAENMYEDWEYDIWNDITDEDILELQSVLDRMLSGCRNICYICTNKVKSDM